MQKLILIGASAGGVAALTRITAALPADLPATVLIVMHIGARHSPYENPPMAYSHQEGV